MALEWAGIGAEAIARAVPGVDEVADEWTETELVGMLLLDLCGFISFLILASALDGAFVWVLDGPLAWALALAVAGAEVKCFLMLAIARAGALLWTLVEDGVGAEGTEVGADEGMEVGTGGVGDGAGTREGTDAEVGGEILVKLLKNSARLWLRV